RTPHHIDNSYKIHSLYFPYLSPQYFLKNETYIFYSIGINLSSFFNFLKELLYLAQTVQRLKMASNQCLINYI
ncbi:MAG: hypothetical protein PUF08_02340, partial [Clostridiales bacterium]|nr:hypothetical protein [Clostridiales bacterium]